MGKNTIMGEKYLDLYPKTYKCRGRIIHDKKVIKDKGYRKEFYTKKENIDEGIKFSIKNVLIGNEVSYPLYENSLNRAFFKNEKDFLNENIYSKVFIDGRHLLNSFRDFIHSTFKTLDLIVYKYNKEEQCLDYYGGNKELDLSKVHIGDFIKSKDNKEYENELKALLYTKENEIVSMTVDNESSGGKLSLKINLPWGESIILSVRIKENLLEIDDLLLDFEFKRLESIFKNTGIVQYLKEELNLIETKYKDYMTGLYNREYLETITRFKKYSILNIDINQFKYINDTYGHANGDKVLKKLAGILYRSIKNNDRVCRMGGDEFIILVSTNSKKELDVLKNRILKKVNDELLFDFDKTKDCQGDCKSCLKIQKGKCERISISIGGVVMNSKKTINDMIKESDKLMFEQKSDEGKKARIISQLGNIDDYKLLLDIYHKVFDHMLEKGLEGETLSDEFISIFKERIKYIKDPEVLNKLGELLKTEIKNKE